ncbi:MAG TPA: SH3 domain-containing protein [Luteimonas sp.]|jgi:cell wall-associated NlpC family hydrolase|nr:SH3 domain-containing protein [Luteimonas sp.]
MTRIGLRCALLALLFPIAWLPAVANADPTAVAMSDHGVPGITPERLAARFWIARLRQPDRVLLDPAEIARRNDALVRTDPSMHDLRALPAQLPGALVRGWIEARAARPKAALFDATGAPIASTVLDPIVDNRDLDSIPRTQPTRYGLVVHRAALRSFPTSLRVFSAIGDTDIDRFQESALFPGTPVVIAHRSRDGQWLFVVSPRYAAWIAGDAIAEGGRRQVLEYADKVPYRIVTDATVRTASTPDAPAVSQLQLDMGVRLPLLPARGDTVNGQNPYTSWSVELPVRDADGKLAFAPALLARRDGTASAPLPLTRANVLRQAFRFLGERYGWGHDYGTRDCSGFVSEVYRSMGVLLPRNTGDQARSPALDRLHFDGEGPTRARRDALRRLQVGDLVYLPGHVMLVIGRIDGAPYVIHDIHDGKVRDAEGRLRSLHLNAVSVTPLMPLRFDDGTSFVDRITDIVRIRRTGTP